MKEDIRLIDGVKFASLRVDIPLNELREISEWARLSGRSPEHLAGFLVLIGLAAFKEGGTIAKAMQIASPESATDDDIDQTPPKPGN